MQFKKYIFLYLAMTLFQINQIGAMQKNYPLEAALAIGAAGASALLSNSCFKKCLNAYVQKEPLIGIAAAGGAVLFSTWTGLFAWHAVVQSGNALRNS